MARVYITDTGGLDFTPGLERLAAAGHEVRLLEVTTGAEVAEHAADADALVVSFVRIDATTIATLPRLKAIATTTVGLDQVDVEAARAAGVDVRALPPLASEEVATHALAGMLAVLRELRAANEAVSGWDFRAIPTPRRLSELTLAVYGMGRIAVQLVARARPLFGRVVGFDPYAAAHTWPAGVDRVSEPEALFATADVLTLHAPSTEETRHVVNDRAIALMPTGAVVVNVARGELVDRSALIDAVDRGHLRGAFLDVLDPAPPAPDDPLLHHPRILLSPHAAFYSDVAARDYVVVAVDQAVEALAQRAVHS